MKSKEIVDTILSIVASPLIDQYKIGITKNSCRRRSQYISVGFEHYVIIDTNLSASSAIKKEQDVFKILTKESNKNSNLYKKYNHNTRDTCTPKSLGGHKPNLDDKYDLYISWWCV